MVSHAFRPSYPTGAPLSLFRLFVPDSVDAHATPPPLTETWPTDSGHPLAFILDGLNEVDNESTREQIRTTLDEFLGDNPSHRACITTRAIIKSGYRWQAYKMSPIPRTEVEKLFSEHCGNPRDLDEKTLELLGLPFFLSMAIRLKREQGDPSLASGERFSRTEGKTPAFVDGEVQRLLDAIDASTHTGLRDRALLATLAYTFARIGSVVNLKVEDYYPSGKRFLLRFKEKGGKEKELPVHHKLEEMLDQYLKATGLEKEPESPLFPAALRKTGKLSRRPLARTDAADMLKRRLKHAGLPAHYSPHSFRATGITNFLENDGTLEAAQRIAGHADSRTTKLYDRRGQKVLLEDMERIHY